MSKVANNGLSEREARLLSDKLEACKDLVKRLREKSGTYDEYAWHSDIELEAADEIERLCELTKA